jgi:NAD-dependent DNA ligase
MGERMPRHKVVSLRGRSIVLTGFLWKPQEEVKRRIRRAGGRIQEDVSRTTDILIRGRPNALYKAADREMGTKLLEVEALDAQGHHVHLIWHDDLHWLLAKRRPAICGRL